MPPEKDLEGRVVLVTGASRGIGRAAARLAGARGAHVIALARTVGGLEELDDEIRAAGGEAATLVPLDLTDFDAIDRIGSSVFERWGRLDGLIANAGQLGIIGPLSHIKPEVFERTLALNVTANYRLVRALEPLLRQSEAGRVAFVSSAAAIAAGPYWALYAASKAALDAMAKSWAGELAQTQIKVNVFYPGPVRTGMRAAAMPGEDPQTLPHPDEIAPALVEMVTDAFARTAMIVDAKTGETRPL